MLIFAFSEDPCVSVFSRHCLSYAAHPHSESCLKPRCGVISETVSPSEAGAVSCLPVFAGSGVCRVSVAGAVVEAAEEQKLLPGSWVSCRGHGPLRRQQQPWASSLLRTFCPAFAIAPSSKLSPVPSAPSMRSDSYLCICTSCRCSEIMFLWWRRSPV